MKTYKFFSALRILGLASFVSVSASHLVQADTLAWRTKKFTDQGLVAPTEMINLSIVLDMGNESGFNQELADIYNPASPRYHQFLKPGEFRVKYAPKPAQIAAAMDFLAKKGFQSPQLRENGYILTFAGNSDSVRAAFGSELHNYKGSDGKIYFANVQNPMIPATLPFRTVHGLDNLPRGHSHAQDVDTSDPTALGLTPAILKKAYNFPPSASASGQCISVFEMSGYNENDISQYAQHYSLDLPPINNVYVDVTSALPASESEAALDIELLIAMAPGLDQIIVYEGSGTALSYLNTYAKIADDDRCKVVSTSWGSYEDSWDNEYMDSENRIFKQMAVQGQSIFAASGDNGVTDGAPTPNVDDPASQPYVTGVGGTHLYVDVNGNYSSEVAWDNTTEGYATGGGVSKIWKIPSWQKGLATSENKVSSSMRNIPDVSLAADYPPGFSYFYQNGWGQVGGTSGSAPIWAAFTALVNHQRQANKLDPIGFLNPTIYRIASTPRYNVDFHDITQGNNGLKGDTEYFPAGVGYDNATGLGSLNAAQLLEDLQK